MTVPVVDGDVVDDIGVKQIDLPPGGAGIETRVCTRISKQVTVGVPIQSKVGYIIFVLTFLPGLLVVGNISCMTQQNSVHDLEHSGITLGQQIPFT